VVGRVRGVVSAVGALLVCPELPPSPMALDALAGRG
jgi:hypothetical protein